MGYQQAPRAVSPSMKIRGEAGGQSGHAGLCGRSGPDTDLRQGSNWVKGGERRRVVGNSMLESPEAKSRGMLFSWEKEGRTA